MEKEFLEESNFDLGDQNRISGVVLVFVCCTEVFCVDFAWQSQNQKLSFTQENKT